MDDHLLVAVIYIAVVAVVAGSVSRVSVDSGSAAELSPGELAKQGV